MFRRTWHRGEVEPLIPLQREPTECAHICVTMLLAMGGVFVSPYRLHSLLEPSARGTRLTDLLRLLRQVGFDAVAVRGARPNDVPRVVLLRCGHYIVVGRALPNSARVFLPESGWATWSADRLQNESCEVGIAVVGFRSECAAGLAESQPSGIWQQWRRHLATPLAAKAMLSHIALQLCTFAIPLFTGISVDASIDAHQNGVTAAAIAFIAISIVTAVMSGLANLFSRKTAASFSLRTSSWLYDQFAAAAPHDLEKITPQYALSRFGSLNQLLSYFHRLAPECVDIVLLIVAGLAAAVILSPVLLLPSVLLVLIGLLVDVLCFRWAKRGVYEAAHSGEASRRFMVDVLPQLSTLVRYGVSTKARAELRGHLRRQALLSNRQGRIEIVKNGISEAVAIVERVIFVWLAAYFYSDHQLSLGGFVAIGIYREAIAQAIQKAFAKYRAYTRLRPHFASIAHPPRPSEPQVDVSPLTSSTQRVVLDGVAFTYEKGRASLLRDVRLVVHENEVVCIRGDSGCGKSSLIRVCLGLLPVCQGTVWINGLPPKVGDTAIGSVLSSDRLMSGTIEQNLRYFRRGVKANDISAALEIVGMEDFVRTLPMGLQTSVGENVPGLSSGQRQRLLIARALCGRPSILVLDEATSQLDRNVEAQLLSRLPTGMATIIVSHRAEVWRFADRLFTLESGRLREELMSKRAA